MIDSFLATPHHNTDVVVVLDTDDVTAADYKLPVMPEIEVTELTRMRFTGKVNYVAVDAMYEYDVIGWLNDDVVFKTNDWEKQIIDSIESGNLICYPDDGFNGQKLCTFPFVDARLVRAVGFMALEAVTHCYCDNYWMEIGRAFGLIEYLPDFLLEHLHPYAGKSEMDETYMIGNNNWQRQRDHYCFEHYKRFDLLGDIEKIREAIK
jgi:hypothetical protein